MSRKRIPRTLPPLAEVFKSFPGFSEESNKQRILVDELRGAAKRLKKRKSQPFYSMREVADFFHAPLRTVAIAYEALESEGLFNRIRSSQTLLVGSTDSTQNLVRGVVGIPVWLHAFVISPYSRALHIELEERLRKKGFVVDFIFFRTGENCEPDFAERLLIHNLNYVIWHTPHPLSAHVLLSLQDHAVRQIIIQPTEPQTSQMRANYLMNWQPAYQAMSKAWRNAGITRVLIPKPLYLPSQQALRNFVKILNAEGMQTQMVELNAPALLEKTRSQSSTAVAFVDQLGADALCNEDQAILEQLLQISRVAFCRGPIRLPYFQHRPGRADIVGFSAAEAADRIVNDLCNRSGDQLKTPHIFEAVYHPQEALNGTWETL